MAAFQYFCLVFLLNILFSTCIIEIPDSKLSKFGHKVKSLLSHKIRKHLFNVNHDSPEQFLQAVHEANQDDAKIFNVTFPDYLDKELNDAVAKVVDTVTPKMYFQIFLNAVTNTLEDEGVLNSKNLNDLAKSLAKYLEDASKSTSKANVAETLPAISSSIFKFFKSQGLVTQEVLILYIKNILKEVVEAEVEE